MPWRTDMPVRLAQWLIPNPVNTYVPQLEREVSKHPSMARRVTGAHVMGSSDKKTLRSCFATPVTDARDLPIDRFPIPRHIICDQGRYQSCFSPSAQGSLPRHKCPLRRMAPRRAQHGASTPSRRLPSLSCWLPSYCEATPSTALVQKLYLYNRRGK
ncbi:hypothetical protein EDD15DRAFT_391151 [Pisolithus albus]|nr:hypothetical protein EDD15DRAFT_391151 [Pisolithus albus]